MFSTVKNMCHLLIQDFRNADELEKFELEIVVMGISHKFLYLIGDFTGCVGCNDDFLRAGNYLARYFDYDEAMLNLKKKAFFLA